jgi:membrane protein
MGPKTTGFNPRQRYPAERFRNRRGCLPDGDRKPTASRFSLTRCRNAPILSSCRLPFRAPMCTGNAMQQKFLSELRYLPQAIHDRVWADYLNRKSFCLGLAVKTTRLAWAVIRDLCSGDPSLRAMSLVYTTILSLVPLLAISFSVLKGFGVHEELETTMMRSLLPLGEQGVEIGIRIIEFVENVKVGVLGSLGLALLLFTVISLMQKIERAYNRTWRVSQDPPFAQRFSGHLSVVIVGPVLVFSSMGITATLMSTDIVASITAIEPFGAVMGWASALLPFALVVGAFTFIYVFMPNTNVNPVSAFVGSLVAGALWHLAGWVFASFVVSSAQTAAIYSAFAGLIVFMLWLHVSWLVLLIGASVAYYHQNPYQTAAGDGETPLSPRMAERVSLALLSEVASAFQAGESRPTTNELVEAALFQTGRPVLLVPDERTPVGNPAIPERAMIGWNWRAEAGRAVVTALPLLQLAKEVVICAIRTAANQGPRPSELAEYLAHHNVAAEIIRPDPKLAPIC